MLVLGRHLDETIVIGGNIIITVTRLSSDIVHLGIDAPPDINIRRGELKPLPPKPPGDGPVPPV
jgi:carbon storage regulator